MQLTHQKNMNKDKVLPKLSTSNWLSHYHVSALGKIEAQGLEEHWRGLCNLDTFNQNFISRQCYVFMLLFNLAEAAEIALGHK